MFSYNLSVIKDGEYVTLSSKDILHMVRQKLALIDRDGKEHLFGCLIVSDIDELHQHGCAYSNHDFDVLSKAYDYAN